MHNEINLTMPRKNVTEPKQDSLQNVLGTRNKFNKISKNKKTTKGRAGSALLVVRIVYLCVRVCSRGYCEH